MQSQSSNEPNPDVFFATDKIAERHAHMQSKNVNSQNAGRENRVPLSLKTDDIDGATSKTRFGHRDVESALRTDDIPGATRKTKFAYRDVASEVVKTSSLQTVDKPKIWCRDLYKPHSSDLVTEDIVGAQEHSSRSLQSRRMYTARQTDPLQPGYTLPKTRPHPQHDLHSQAPQRRSSGDVADIQGTAPRRLHRPKDLGSMPVEAIEGSHPGWKPLHKEMAYREQRPVNVTSDINTNHRTWHMGNTPRRFAGSDPLEPCYYFDNGEYGSIDGTSNATSFRHRKIKPKPRAGIMDVSDINDASSNRDYYLCKRQQQQQLAALLSTQHKQRLVVDQNTPPQMPTEGSRPSSARNQKPLPVDPLIPAQLPQQNPRHNASGSHVRIQRPASAPTRRHPPSGGTGAMDMWGLTMTVAQQREVQQTHEDIALVHALR